MVTDDPRVQMTISELRCSRVRLARLREHFASFEAERRRQWQHLQDDIAGLSRIAA